VRHVLQRLLWVDAYAGVAIELERVFERAPEAHHELRHHAERAGLQGYTTGAGAALHCTLALRVAGGINANHSGRVDLHNLCKQWLQLRNAPIHHR
jgi:hypothetical protein